MRSIITVTALLTIIDGSCSVFRPRTKLPGTTGSEYNMRALCTDTSIILIAKDTHLNSDQGQSRHGLAPQATDTTIYCLWLAAIGPLVAMNTTNAYWKVSYNLTYSIDPCINVNCIRDESFD